MGVISASAPTRSVPNATRSSLSFVARFAGGLLLLGVANALLEPHLGAVTTRTAAVLAWISSALGLSATPHGDLVTFDGAFTYRIAPECLATVPMILFVAGVVAFPSSRRHRLAAVALFVPTLVGLNGIRLLVMGWVGVRYPGSFDAVHGLWFEALMLIATGVAWLVWAQYVTNRADKTSTIRLHSLGIVPRFVALYLALAVVALATPIDEAYSVLVSMPAQVVGAFIWDFVTIYPERDAEFVGFQWGTLAAFVALTLATPGVHRSERTRAAARGAAMVWALQILSIVLTAALTMLRDGEPAEPGSSSIFGVVLPQLFVVVAVSAVPLVQWMTWTRRARLGRLPRRAQRTNTTASARKP